jgi:hypothetical protein
MSGAESDGLLTPEEEEELPPETGDCRAARAARAAGAGEEAAVLVGVAALDRLTPTSLWRWSSESRTSTRSGGRRSWRSCTRNWKRGGVKSIVVKFTTPGGTEVHGPTLLKGKVVLDDPL